MASERDLQISRETLDKLIENSTERVGCLKQITEVRQHGDVTVQEVITRFGVAIDETSNRLGTTPAD